jgi:NTE family protein
VPAATVHRCDGTGGIGIASLSGMTGLVMTAGGARGAYQAGVLKRIAELRALRTGPSPFHIVAGASAGAINGAMIASGTLDFAQAARSLTSIWAGLEMGAVVRTDAVALGRGGLGLARDLAFGSLLGHTVSRGLLDASPLYALLANVIPLAGIPDAIRRGQLYAAALTATSYHSGRSYTFVQGRRGHPVWQKSRRLVLPVELTAEHVCASAAIPLIFPPVRISSLAGDLWFGDGALRLVTPLSPAIRLGASRLLAIGVRSSGAADALSRAELNQAIACPPLAQVCGVFLNAIFLDHLDTDLDHLRRMNELIEAYGQQGPPPTSVSEPMRPVAALALSPSEDLALVARQFAHRMPRVLRGLMEGLGTPDAESADLMSYLLFDGAFTRALIDIGYRDAEARIDEIEAFLRAADALASRAAG